jgi:hypothetical protein
VESDDAIRFVFVAVSKSIVSIERPLLSVVVDDDDDDDDDEARCSSAEDNKMFDMSSINSSSTFAEINVDESALNECNIASFPIFTVVLVK